jgi:hypothetical protein
VNIADIKKDGVPPADQIFFPVDVLKSRSGQDILQFIKFMGMGFQVLKIRSLGIEMGIIGKDGYHLVRVDML